MFPLLALKTIFMTHFPSAHNQHVLLILFIYFGSPTTRITLSPRRNILEINLWAIWKWKQSY